MPPQQTWDDFFQVNEILRQLRLNPDCHNVVEFGCGYGTFTLPAARIVSGTVHATDIDPRVLDVAKENAAEAGLLNIDIAFRDFVSDGSGLADQSVDYAMLFNILHLDEPVTLLREAYRNLEDNGLLGVIHWIHDGNTPRGPPLESHTPIPSSPPRNRARGSRTRAGTPWGSMRRRATWWRAACSPGSATRA